MKCEVGPKEVFDTVISKINYVGVSCTLIDVKEKEEENLERYDVYIVVVQSPRLDYICLYVTVDDEVRFCYRPEN
jgi:RNA-binding protein YlmH